MTVILAGVLFSCKKNDAEVIANADIIGNWKLIEVLIDPGDGSGTYQPVASSKTVLFESNGKVSSNGSICDLSIDSYTASTGTYSVIDATITATNCSALPIRYQVNGNNLIIIYQCIEACKVKYVKVK